MFIFADKISNINKRHPNLTEPKNQIKINIKKGYKKALPKLETSITLAAKTLQRISVLKTAVNMPRAESFLTQGS